MKSAGSRWMACTHLFLMVALSLLASDSYAFLGYLKGYKVGLDYTSATDSVQATYRVPASGGIPGEVCEVDGSDEHYWSCTARPTGSYSSGFGVFLQQAFKRQGLFHFAADIGFGFRLLQGKLPEKEILTQKKAGLPLKSLNYNLGAVVIRPYIQFGLTPREYWPDLLISLGPSLQVAAGTVAVNGKKETVALGTASGSGLDAFFKGFLEIELVLWRFGNGALSVFVSQDATSGSAGTKFYPKAIDGMDNIKANFSRYVGGAEYPVGIKLLMDWP